MTSLQLIFASHCVCYQPHDAHVSMGHCTSHLSLCVSNSGTLATCMIIMLKQVYTHILLLQLILTVAVTCCSVFLCTTVEQPLVNSVPCPPGQYGSDPLRLTCSPCEPGYVCLGGTTTATPTDVATQKGMLLCMLTLTLTLPLLLDYDQRAVRMRLLRGTTSSTDVKMAI